MQPILGNRYQEEELMVIGRNDEHYRSMIEDREFYKDMQQKNTMANEQLNLTQAGDNAAQNAEVLVKNTNEDWINKKWRPAMGWMYMGVCIFDFIIFPILWAVVQFWETQAANDAFRQWQPMTLMGAGLFHISMGAILGIAVYGRTQEKMKSMQNTNGTNEQSGSPGVLSSLK